MNTQNSNEHPAIIINDNGGEEVLKIGRDGVITWTRNGEKKACEDFKDLAKAFLYTILKLSPEADVQKNYKMKNRSISDMLEIIVNILLITVLTSLIIMAFMICFAIGSGWFAIIPAIAFFLITIYAAKSFGDGLSNNTYK